MSARASGFAILLAAACTTPASAPSTTPAPPAASSPAAPLPAPAPTPIVAVGPQYDTTHVYVNAQDVDRFATSFLATFGGHSTKQAIVTVTPTPSTTSSQLLQTPVGTVSLFGFRTGVPYPFGAERNGYLVTDMATAIQAARTAGADVIVTPFDDPIGRDAVVQWPGGVNMQLYWHTKTSSYEAFQLVPENRVYVSPDRADAFVRSFLAFAHGNVVSDEPRAPGVEIGRPSDTFRRIRIESTFGKLTALVTDGHVPYPFGHETTGYEVRNLGETLAKARQSGATVLVEPFHSGDRDAAMIEFPGGYIAELHARSDGG
jgi:predicted enzyme related to lactoylglutathione lyase